MKLLFRTTKRLTIRPLESGDYLAWKMANTSRPPKKNKWDRENKNPEQVSRASFIKVIASQKKLRKEDKFFDLAVFENASGKLIGAVSVMDVLRGPGQSAYLGYSIENLYWGQGFGKEAVRAIIDIAFKDLVLHRIEAGIEPTNRRSILLARALGLRKEGLKKRAVFLRGQWTDLVMYSATCEEFGFKWKRGQQTRLR